VRLCPCWYLAIVIDESSSAAILNTPPAIESSTSTNNFHLQFWTRLGDRVLPAIGMLAACGGIAHWGKEDGLIYFTLLLQLAMYTEMTRVIGGDFAHAFYKWYWFTSSSLAWNAPKMMPWLSTEIATVVTVMTMVGIMTAIIHFQYKGAQVEEYRDWLRQAAVSILSAVRSSSKLLLLWWW
jgi:hypothetical protein